MGWTRTNNAVKVVPATKSLATLVRGAEWMGKGAAPAAPSSVVAGVVAADASSSAAASPEPPPFAASPEPPLASPVAPEPTLDIPTRIDGDAIEITLGDRVYRVRGLERNTGTSQMKVCLRVARGDALHVDTLDMNASRARREYAREAAAELGVAEDTVRHDLGRVWLRLEQLAGERDREAGKAAAVVPAMTDSEREEALELLRDPRLLERILEDFARCGVVGEETNKLVGYLAAVSRKLAKPLGVLIQSSSAAGKSSLMEAILAFVPEEERVKYSAMTGQALFYMADADLRHKVLAIVEEEGAATASYALKLLQSEGELAIASTGKDAQTGRLVTHEYRVEGPVMLLLTTTAIDIDEELQNRSIVLTVDEEREQTRAIHREQREMETEAGLWAGEERAYLRRLHCNAQRLLRPLAVINPYARQLTFLDDRTRTRRDHVKYLGIIRAVTLVHQYQRPVERQTRGGVTKEYLVVTKEDIAVANRLAHEVLGRSLDELPPQTRRFARMLARLADESSKREGTERSAYRTTQRGMRESTGWSAAQVKAHVAKLVEMEYVIAHAGVRGQPWEYEVLYEGEGDGGGPFLMGLIDVERLEAGGYDASREDRPQGWEHENGGWEQAGRYEGGSREVRGRTVETECIPNQESALWPASDDTAENAYREDAGPSYPKNGRSRGPTVGAGA